MTGASAPSRAPAALSVVIVSWNTRELLLDALESLLPLEGLEAEVIVVDNASSDGSAEAVSERYPGVRVVRNPRNLGFAGGVNTGFREARHPYVLLLNTDTEVRGDAPQALLRYAQAHPEAGVVGPRVLNRDGSLQASRFRFPSLLNLLLSSTYLYKAFPRSRFFNRERLAGDEAGGPVDAVSGCAFLVRADLIERIGGFDEGFFMYAEETDFCFRAWQAGFEVHFAPVAEIVHFGGGSSRLARRRNFLEYRRSMVRYFHKHQGRVRAELARLLLAVFLVLRLPYWGLRALTARGADAPARGQLANYLAGVRFLLQPLPRILAAPDAPGGPE